MQKHHLMAWLSVMAFFQAGCDTKAPPEATKPAIETVKIEANRISVVYPAGATIPEAFLNAPFNNSTVYPKGPAIADCMIMEKQDAKCDMAVIDLDHDGKSEIALLSGNELFVYAPTDSDFDWMTFPVQTLDEKTVRAFKAGQIFTHRQLYDDLGVGTNLIEVSKESVGEGFWINAQKRQRSSNGTLTP